MVIAEDGLAIAAAVELLRDSPDWRVLRRVDLEQGIVRLGSGTGLMVGAAVDVETTGLDHATDRIIELAIRRFAYDRSGRIVRLDAMRSWREDPLMPIPAEVTRITGLADADVAGHRIDDGEAAALLNSCAIVISHNSLFDRDFVEARLPAANGLAWGCSVADVDWRALGFESRMLGWLLFQTGRFYDAHRANSDVDALIELLRHELPDGDTVLATLLRSAARDGWLVRADGAHFDVRAALKDRGYRWSAAGGVWLREIADGELEGERRWLADAVYAPGLRARGDGPRIDHITSRNRHRRPH